MQDDREGDNEFWLGLRLLHGREGAYQVDKVDLARKRRGLRQVRSD